MTAAQWKWLIGLVALAAIGGGLWYANGRGWLKPAETWMRKNVSNVAAKKSTGDGMGMNMPEMGMGSMGRKGVPSGVKGYADVEVAPEVQQRIGVTIGRVERAPLRMSVRTVGIVRPDETKTAHIHVRTEGWVEKLFVNYTGQKVRKGEPFLSIYSPEFYRTQLDYVTARRSEHASTLARGEAHARRPDLTEVEAPGRLGSRA